MKVEFSLFTVDVGYDGVSSVVTTSATSADIGFSGENVDKFTLACVNGMF